MDNAKFWWSSSETPQPPVPPVDVIRESLRFRGASSLTRTATGTSSVWTSSYWVKRGAIGGVGGAAEDALFSSNGFNQIQRFQADNTLLVGLVTPNSEVYRDPSAWYHIVVSNNGADTKVWVNGRQIASGANHAADAGNDMQIGQMSTVNAEHYKANFYFIDGQALESTAFGRYNDQGVWVPREVDFTPAGMRFSDMVTSSTGGYQPSAGPDTMFDGNLTTYVQSSTSPATITFTPQEPIPFNTLRVNSYRDADQEHSLNGGAFVSHGTDGSQEWWTVSSTPGTLESLAFKGTWGGQVAAIEVTDDDGTRILTNPFIWSTGLQLQAGQSFAPAFPLANGFDGNLSTFCEVDPDGSAFTYAPNPAIPFTREIAFYADGNMDQTTWNGNNFTDPGTTGWFTFKGSGELSEATPINFQSAGSFNNFYAIRVDGQILVDGVNSSYGANGFHLDFADPNDLGADRSGNGNDFTPSGFNTAPVGIFTQDLFTDNNNTNTPDLTTTDRSFGGGSNVGQAFDNNLASAAQSNGNNTWLVFRPTIPIVVTNELRVGLISPTQDVWVNGVSTGQTQPNSNVQLFTDAFPGNNPPGGYPITVESIAVRGDNVNAMLSAIQVDGTTLLNNTGADYDVMQDSPTQNYATLNPLIGPGTAPGPSVINTARANLQAGPAQSGSDGFVNSTIFTNQETYVESTVQSVQNQMEVAFVEDQVRLGGGSSPFVNFFGFNQSSTCWVRDADQTRRDISLNATDQTFGFHVRWADGRIDVYHNGAVIGSSTGWTFGAPRTFAVGSNGASGVLTMTWNYGQQPFLQRPAALGDGTELQTQNLPAATITNGRDHFQAITGPGTGVADGTFPNQLNGGWAGALTAPGGFLDNFGPEAAFGTAEISAIATDPSVVMTFEPDTPIPFTTHFRFCSNHAVESPGEFSFNGGPWTAITGFGGHNRVDYATNGQTIATGPGQLESFRIRRLENADQPAIFWMQIDDDILVDSGILQLAQQTFPQGLWWIKSRVVDGNTNQHQLVDSVRGGNLALQTPASSEIAYVAPAGNSVAWCWNVNGDAAANGDGSIASQVAANTDAGFSIVTYTGTGNAGTVGHGLNSPLDFMIVKDRGRTENWHVWCTGLQLDFSLNLNTPGIAEDFNCWNDLEPTDSIINLGTGNGSNRLNSNYVAYCWHSVPGYSAFGSVSSGQDSFAYMGFRPAFLLTKQTGSTGDWLLWDTTRDINNPSTSILITNQATGEETGRGHDIDILSNGIKFRGTSGSMSGNLIYAAFAENPTAGINVSPANAR